MKSVIKTISKIILIGILTTIFRICAQAFIPVDSQTVLPPSVFAQNGTLPFIFTPYAILVYSLLTSMFLLIKRNLSGHKLLQGFSYGLALCMIWVIYLFEPLPHINSLINRISYPIADGLSLLFMGLLIGIFLGETKPNHLQAKSRNLFPILMITLSFCVGRALLYSVFDIYSCVHDKLLETVLWTILTGMVTACSLSWFNQYTVSFKHLNNALLLGGLIFGVNLTFFNFFMPLVMQPDMVDLFIRTAIDIVSILLGCLSLSCNEKQTQSCAL